MYLLQRQFAKTAKVIKIIYKIKDFRIVLRTSKRTRININVVQNKRLIMISKRNFQK